MPTSRPLLYGTLPPSIVSLFDSTSSSPLSLSTLTLDADLPQDSGAAFLNDASGSRPSSDLSLTSSASSSPSSHLQLRDSNSDQDDDDDEDRGPSTSFPRRKRKRLDQTVLHLQSPTLRTTHLTLPPPGSSLGLSLPVLHFQLRPLGSARPLSLEVGISDPSGRRLIIRASTFQQRAILRSGGSVQEKGRDASQPRRGSEESAAAAAAGQDRGSAPLLHLPLILPYDPRSSTPSSVTLTSWLTLTLPLSRLVSFLSDPSLRTHLSSSSSTFAQDDDDEEESPAPILFTHFSTLDYVRVHANCRLKRIWASEAGVDEVHVARVGELGVYA